MAQQKDSSTYSAMFAVLLILLLIIIIGYSAVQNLLADDQEVLAEIEREIQGESTDSTVLYNNLTNEEANQIINQLLRDGETNFEKIEEIEGTLTE